MTRPLIPSFLVSLIMALGATAAFAADFYISPSGNDKASGSASSPWKTIAKVNSKNFSAGDRILFQGGNTFAGGLRFDANDHGTATSPITISSYGSGRATINSGSSSGLYAYRTAGMHITNLNFVGSGRTNNAAQGIMFYLDLANTKLDHVTCDQLNVSGYGDSGVIFGSWNVSKPGYTNVRITNVISHDNGRCGIKVYGYESSTSTTWSHRNFYLANCLVYNNPGDPLYTANHSGSGIVLGDVDGATIEYSEAHHNGWLNRSSGGGPVGIWSYDSNNVVVQFCESHHNSSGYGPYDGGGFDCDGGDTNCILQYNYSHDNEGAGYLVGNYPGSRATRNNTVRYNITENDARKHSHGSIHVYGGTSCLIHNNTSFASPAPTGSPKGLLITTGGTRVFNNIFQTTGGATLAEVNSTTILSGNCYYPTGGQFKMVRAGAAYFALADFKSATGQEANGLQADPKLAGAGMGVTIGNPNLLKNLTGYKLLDSSPLISAGLTLSSAFGINPGTRDYFGNSLPQGGAFDIGAHERAGTATAPPPSPSNQLPVARISASTISGTAPLAVSFSGGTSTDADGSLVSYAWNFGDNSSATGVNVSHAYSIAGSYRATLTVTDNAGGVGSTSTTITVSAPAGSGTGTGLTGQYFDNMDFTGTSISRTDAAVNFNWALGSPASTIGVDTFSARWTGQVQAQHSQTYTFHVTGDDGVRLWVNGSLLIDKWILQSATEWSGSIALVAGTKYNIRIDYFENAGDAVAQLRWSSASTPKANIPSSQLYPAATVGTGLTGQYFDNLDFTGTSISRTDATVNFNWALGSPANTIGIDTFSARWTGQVQAQYSQTYTFSVTGDDGVRLWVNGVLLIDKWIIQAATEYSASIALIAGNKYDIKLEYYENLGDAAAQLRWSSASTPKTIIPSSQLYPFAIIPISSG